MKSRKHSKRYSIKILKFKNRSREKKKKINNKKAKKKEMSAVYLDIT